MNYRIVSNEKIRDMLVNEHHVVISIDGKKDEKGETPFTMYWLTDYIPGQEDNGKLKLKAQCFRTGRDMFALTLKKDGYIVHVIDANDTL